MRLPSTGPVELQVDDELCRSLNLNFSPPVSEGSETPLPTPGGQEIQVTLSFIMVSGEIHVRKETEAKTRSSKVIILCEPFMNSSSSFRFPKETLQC